MVRRLFLPEAHIFPREHHQPESCRVEHRDQSKCAHIT